MRAFVYRLEEALMSEHSWHNMLYSVCPSGNLAEGMGA